MRHLLLVMALAVVGCGGDETAKRGHSPDWFRGYEAGYADGNKYPEPKSYHSEDTCYTKVTLRPPDYVTPDSFIVGYDTTGWEKKMVYVGVDSVESFEHRYALRYGDTTGIYYACDTATIRRTVPLYKEQWQPIIVPIYAPKVVVQLTPDKAEILNQILEACVNYDTSYGEFVVYISQKALDSTAENGQHEN